MALENLSQNISHLRFSCQFPHGVIFAPPDRRIASLPAMQIDKGAGGEDVWLIFREGYQMAD